FSDQRWFISSSSERESFIGAVFVSTNVEAKTNSTSVEQKNLRIFFSLNRQKILISTLAQPINTQMSAELARLQEDKKRIKHWKKWGPYLTERQWGTVREDYSPDGAAWENVTHDDAKSKAYRWGEEGIAGISDYKQKLCLAWAFWNGKDPIIKERLFGLTGNQGNHGEDVKEIYYYLDSTPTHSYMKMLYKYPQAEYPYDRLIEENRTASKTQ